MRVVAKVDSNGLFIGDVLLEDNAPTPRDAVETRPREGFRRPRYDGTAWTEGMATAEILTVVKSAKRAELAQAFVAANTVLYPEVSEEFAIWLAVPEYAASPNGARPTAIRSNILRFQDRRSKVDAATTEAGVLAVIW